MNRRGFLGLLGVGAAGFVLDPELALWRPGQRTFFLPSPRVALAVGDWVTFGVPGARRLDPLGNEYIYVSGASKVTPATRGPVGIVTGVTYDGMTQVQVNGVAPGRVTLNYPWINGLPSAEDAGRLQVVGVA